MKTENSGILLFRFDYHFYLARELEAGRMSSTLGRADIERCESEDRRCERDGSSLSAFIELPLRYAKSCDSYSDFYFLADSFLDSFLGEFLSSTLTR